MMHELCEFMASLLIVGMNGEKVAEKGYDFALAQLAARERKDDSITPAMMSRAAADVQTAMPEAWRLYYNHYKMR